MVVIVLLVTLLKTNSRFGESFLGDLAVGRRTPVEDGLCKLGAEELWAEEYVHKHQNDQRAAALSGELAPPDRDSFR
jgi:hypothetical protein